MTPKTESDVEILQKCHYLVERLVVKVKKISLQNSLSKIKMKFELILRNCEPLPLNEESLALWV